MLNGVTLGVTTSDVIADLSGQEISRGPMGDRLARLAGHLVQQRRAPRASSARHPDHQFSYPFSAPSDRSYYPVFPPARGSMIDYNRREFLEMPCAPDLLVTPSKITPFAKLVTVPADDLTAPAVEGQQQAPAKGQPAK